MEDSSTRTAVLLGATGLVGGFCLNALVRNPHYTRVVIFARRAAPFVTQPKVSQRVTGLERLSAAEFQGVQDIFIALGTTIRKARFAAGVPAR